MSLNVTFAMGALIRNDAGWNKDAYIDNIKKTVFKESCYCKASAA